MKLAAELNEVTKLKKSGKAIFTVGKDSTKELENFCEKPLFLTYWHPDEAATKKVAAQIDNIRERSGQGRIVFILDREDTIHFSGLTDEILDLEITIDADEQLTILRKISDEQRAKIFALIRELGDFLGETPENARENLTIAFCSATERERFSLSNVDKEIAGEFIKWLITFAFEVGAGLDENPREYLDDIEAAVEICIAHRKCIICGRPADIHHVDAIGMGRNRKTVDDSQARKIPLCRAHHNEAHNTGVETFARKYHLSL